MPQRQPRLGDILDDYCPRERRLTNHAVVAMIGDTVRLTRCTTCDAEHDYKEGKIPRPRKKVEAGALAVPAVFVPKRVVHDPRPADNAPVDDALHLHAGSIAEVLPPENPLPVIAVDAADDTALAETVTASFPPVEPVVAAAAAAADAGSLPVIEEGPVHRQLIRAQLPRHEGQPVTARQTPDFTIRQPAGRHNRFRPRGPRDAGSAFQGPSFRSSGSSTSGNGRGNGPRPAGQLPTLSRLAKRQGPPRRRSK